MILQKLQVCLIEEYFFCCMHLISICQFPCQSFALWWYKYQMQTYTAYDNLPHWFQNDATGLKSRCDAHYQPSKTLNQITARFLISAFWTKKNSTSFPPKKILTKTFAIWIDSPRKIWVFFKVKNKILQLLWGKTSG